jgi:hypothetical protein
LQDVNKHGTPIEIASGLIPSISHVKKRVPCHCIQQGMVLSLSVERNNPKIVHEEPLNVNVTLADASV